MARTSSVRDSSAAAWAIARSTPVGRGQLGVDAQVPAVVLVRLDAPRDAVHHHHGAHRVGAGRGLGGQHHGVAAGEDRRGHVRHLGAGRLGVLDHRLEHLRGDDARLAVPQRGRDQGALRDRHRLRRELDPQVAARDHDPVGRGQDRLDPVDGLGPLDLGDQGGARGPDERAQLLEIRGRAHERQRQVVGAEIGGEAGVLAVLVRHGRRRHRDVGQVDALAVAEHPAVHDRAGDLGAVDGVDDQLQQPVGQQHAAPDDHVVGQRGVLGRDQPGAARHVARGDDDALAVVQLDAAAREAPDADLRPAQVGQHGDRPAPRRRADGLVRLAVGLVVAVGEVQAEDVRARRDELAEPLHRRAGRPHGRDDLRAPPLEQQPPGPSSRIAIAPGA